VQPVAEPQSALQHTHTKKKIIIQLSLS
jgi:hypothetical protein